MLGALTLARWSLKAGLERWQGLFYHHTESWGELPVLPATWELPPRSLDKMPLYFIAWSMYFKKKTVQLFLLAGMFLLLRSLNFIFNPLQLFHCERIPGEVASRVCSVSLLFVIYFTSGLQIKHYFKTFLILLMWPLASLILKWLLPRLGFRRKLKFPLFTQRSP